jgi:hypothetical protein
VAKAEKQSAPTVFICYAREDEVSARNIYGKLTEAGFDPWLDKEKLLLVKTGTSRYLRRYVLPISF